MPAWWSGTIHTFQAASDEALLDVLAHRAVQHFRVNEATQLFAWREQISILRRALAGLAADAGWRLLLEFEVPRLGGRIDAVLLLPGAIFVIEFKVGACRHDGDALRQTDDYALDLQDFHAGSRRHPIVPILVATDAPSVAAELPLPLSLGAAPVLRTNAASLGEMLAALSQRFPAAGMPLDIAGWEDAPYRPVPGVIDAACGLYLRHDVRDIASARADAENLTRTAARIDAILRDTRALNSKAILFVSGIPGAGKTLCGLNAAFGTAGEAGANFLTGNPTLVHVLRDALVRDAVARGTARPAARHRMEGVIQALTRFRDDGVRTGAPPPERVVVIDEAQRSWTRAQAIAKSRDRPVRLDRSEPAHLLDIMGRHEGFAAILCLIGQGQEIHDGEGGLACWGEALRERPGWMVHAASATLSDPEPRNRLGALPRFHAEEALHLDVPVRSLRHDHAPRWVDAVLRGDAAQARAVVDTSGPVPFRLVRDLTLLRQTLRASSRDVHRAGLVASAGAKRLRAEGVGAELPHTDADAVARWFLDSWHRDRDVRASDALEVPATQFAVQGLELDHVGLCWDGDLVRRSGRAAWDVRSFRGTRWQIARDADKIAWRLNTYRVLLTRARYETVIWVPRGDADDPTRDPALFDEVADFLERCGARPAVPAAAVVPAPASLLL
ncbi:DNA/RNA helicase domain-containing protein [Rhizosaccharibacter radicis]|uniref:DUF2075 domain-containing protein n=1 Tax=Rhizosaccharibacter radicis TaxID=2782605 RepID=A0ABT1W114_9PROT|nr:DUF2075 domain-containing protein [Acetobacteraceae bacterium KSS12]